MGAEQLTWVATDRRDERTAAFEQLLANYERPILRLCYRLLGNLADAQDTAQEVFLKVHRNLHRLRSEDRPGPWLYQIALNACRDRWRARRGTVEEKMVPLDVARHSRSSDSPENFAREEELRRLVFDALAQLPEKERAAFVLRELEGLETREVSELLGVTEAAVRGYVFQARAKMKKRLGKTGLAL
jgi:RNA polymerase sigma-70 factor, ECF subfamily